MQCSINILSKTLANSLKVVLYKCISEEQPTFIEGRSILDNTLSASEILHYLKCKTHGKVGELALKKDIN